MRRYGHQCQTLFGLFNSFFLSPPIRCISRSLSVLIFRSLCLAFSPCPLASPILPSSISPRWSHHRRSRHADLTIADLTTLRDRDRPGSPQIIDPLCNEEELQCEGTVARSVNFHLQGRRMRFRMWVCLIWWMGCSLLNFIIDLVDLGCEFVWFGGCGFVPVVGLFNLVDV